MIQLYNIDQAKEWDDIVCSFDDYDIYYLSGYVKAFMIHGDGDPYLFYYEGEELRGIYVYMKRKTAIEGVFDSITPYGYGGFLLEGYASNYNMKALWSAYVEKMKEEGIVDNFVRYHSVLANADPMRVCSDVIDLGKTVAIDLTSEEVIWKNMHTKNRNMIRKAEKSGVVIKHGKGLELLEEFRKIYNATMNRDDAEEYYFFKTPFYESIHRDLKDNYEVFWAENEGKVIAMSIMIHANGRLNYHLSGSDFEYRKLAPTNLLLYKSALWGCEQGMRTLHLGGGVGSTEDSLYRFKAVFNRFSNCQFSISKQIFDQEKYDALVAERAAKDANFDKDSKFFPLYRS